MKEKMLWLAVSCLIVAALVLGSCAPAAPAPAPTPTPTPTPKPKPVEKEAVVPAVKGPQYGGTLTALHLHATLEPQTWDPADVNWIVSPMTSPFWETLTTGDLSKGPRGTNQYTFQDAEYVPDEFITGALAESWETPDPTTFIYHLRKGVRWPDKPGVMTSREMTADDIVFSLNRMMDSPRRKALGYYSFIQSVTAKDKYTVVVKLTEFDVRASLFGWAYFGQIYPPEVAKAGITNWKNLVGSGPFIFKDYVSGASLTYEKNPNYWGKTTIGGKEYNLPFIDKLQWPIIVDESTRLAALRTAKVDLATSVSWKYKKSLEETNPELVRYRWLTMGWGGIAMRNDVKPFDDIRVRRALSMAIDRKAIVDSLYGGEGEILNGPFSKKWPETLYTPLDKLTPAAKELFEYNPEKAKQLLAEAGLSKGFKGEMVISSTGTAQSDMSAMLLAYWKQVGVEVEIKPYDYAVYLSIMYGKKHKQMYYMSKGHGDIYDVLMVTGLPGQEWNPANFNDPYFNETYAKMQKTVDQTERYKLLKELNIHEIEKAPYVILPGEYFYLYNYPWVKNFFGEINMGKRHYGAIYANMWLDRDLREKMIGKR